MNTKTLEKYEVLNSEMLARVEGGYNTSDCLKDYGKGFLSGTAAGAAWGSIAGGIGALPGAFVGAHVGIIGGGLACIGNMLGK